MHSSFTTEQLLTRKLVGCLAYIDFLEITTALKFRDQLYEQIFKKLYNINNEPCEIKSRSETSLLVSWSLHMLNHTCQQTFESDLTNAKNDCFLLQRSRSIYV